MHDRTRTTTTKWRARRRPRVPNCTPGGRNRDDANDEEMLLVAQRHQRHYHDDNDMRDRTHTATATWRARQRLRMPSCVPGGHNRDDTNDKEMSLVAQRHQQHYHDDGDVRDRTRTTRRARRRPCVPNRAPGGPNEDAPPFTTRMHRGRGCNHAHNRMRP